MNSFGIAAQAAFYALLAGLLVTAFLAVTVRNIFRAAIFLAFTLLGVSFIYFFLKADFLAGVQILLYVGAIMAIVIFAIMLTSKIADPNVPQSNKQRYSVLFLTMLLGSFLIRVILKTPWKIAENQTHLDAIQIGQALMGPFVFPFELISVVLLIALVGAIVLARSDE